MTNFEVARRFSGLSAADLARQLGVSPQQLNGWLHGDRLPNRASVESIAEKMDVDAAWLMGVPQMLPVTAQSGKVNSCPVIYSEKIPEGVKYHVYVPDSDNFAQVIIHPLTPI